MNIYLLTTFYIYSILNNFLYFLLLTFTKLVTLGLLHFEGSYYFTSLCTNQMVGTIVHKRQSYWCTNHPGLSYTKRLKGQLSAARLFVHTSTASTLLLYQSICQSPTAFVLTLINSLLFYHYFRMRILQSHERRRMVEICRTTFNLSLEMFAYLDTLHFPQH